MKKDFERLLDQLEPNLSLLIKTAPLTPEQIKNSKNRAGVYVFYERNTPVYVGRTKNLKRRFLSHHNTKNPNMGSFVFLMACETYGRKTASYKKEGSRKGLRKDSEFMSHFLDANSRLKKMTIKFVDIPDPRMQHIFEIYAAMCLETPYNSFNTH